MGFGKRVARHDEELGRTNRIAMRGSEDKEEKIQRRGEILNCQQSGLHVSQVNPTNFFGRDKMPYARLGMAPTMIAPYRRSSE